MHLLHGFRRDALRGDIFGGITAAVVALPLALAFGVASGAGPIAGLYGAILLGFFAALFGGTPSQVSGPTGPMTVVMATVILHYVDEPGSAFAVVVLGGAFQVAFGLARLGSLISLIPFTAISGFMSGIGVIIITLQLAPLLGETAAAGGTLEIVKSLPHVIANLHPEAAAIGALSLAIVWFTPTRVTRLVPAPLLALIVGTALVWSFLPDVPVLGEIPTGFPEFRLPSFSLESVTDIVGSALFLALLGTLDSLLTSLVADSMTGTFHNSNRELIGQGIGNMIAGLFGGIPGAGATMRTVVNIRSGGSTPVSGMVHALVLLAVALGLGPLASHIPHAVLAGILIKVGVDIIDWGYLRRAARAPRPGVLIMFLVFGLTVFVDLIMAVTVGLILSSMLFVMRMQAIQIMGIRSATGMVGEVPVTEAEQALLERLGNRIMMFQFDGPFSFAAAKDISRRIKLDHQVAAVILDLSNMTLIDTSVALSIEDAVTRIRKAGATPFIVGLRAPVRKVLEGLNVLDALPSEYVVADRMHALELAGTCLRPDEAVGADVAGRAT